MFQFYPLLFSKLEVFEIYVSYDNDDVFKDEMARDLEDLLKNDKLDYL
jgi:hypothetical protein